MPDFLLCGERGIRTPGPLTVNGFQDRRNRPLCHLSAAKIIRQTFVTKSILRYYKGFFYYPIIVKNGNLLW